MRGALTQPPKAGLRISPMMPPASSRSISRPVLTRSITSIQNKLLVGIG